MFLKKVQYASESAGVMAKPVVPQALLQSCWVDMSLDGTVEPACLKLLTLTLAHPCSKCSSSSLLELFVHFQWKMNYFWPDPQNKSQLIANNFELFSNGMKFCEFDNKL